MRLKHSGLICLLGAGALVASQSETTPCSTPPISTCSSLRTIYLQRTVTATNVLSAGYITITQINRAGSTINPNPSTTTIAQPTGNVPGTVEIYYNPTTITSTTLESVTVRRTGTISEQVGSTPGLVEVVIPAYTTATVFDNGDTVRTSTIREPVGTSQGLLELVLPAFITRTTLTGSVTITTTVAQPAGTTPGTVEVLLPAYVTITTTTGSISSTNTLSTPNGTVRGTVQVLVPTPTLAPASRVVYCNLNGARTATPDPAATGAASNKGLQYGLWDSPFFDSPPFDQNTGFATYDVTYFDASGRGAIHIGKTERIGTSATNAELTKPIYADTTQAYKTNDITLIHRGFVYARTAGTYSFTSINPDDIILVWVNQNAISGFTRDNANEVKSYPAETNSYTIVLTAGQYLPFRIQWANGGLPSSLTFRITGPAGNTLLDANGSTDIVTAACDGSTPELPQWNQAIYVTSTVTSGYAAPTTTTLAISSGSVTGTVEVIVPTPVYCTSTTSVGTAPGASATNNRGLQYAVFNSTTRNSPPYPADEFTGFSAYPVDSYDSQTAVHVGTTNSLGVDQNTGGLVQIYSDAPNLRYDFELITIVHRGFIFARQAGTYTFTSNFADDINLIWTGTKAVSGFTRQNADLVHTYSEGTETPRQFRFTMNQGEYLPLRVQYANGNGPGGFNITLTGPDGEFRIAPNQTMTDVVTNSCYGNTVTFPAYRSAK